MSKALPIELRTIAVEQRKAITENARWINSLPMNTEYKVLFLSMRGERGWQNIQDFKSELIQISEQNCEVIKLFLKGKLCGLKTIYKIAMSADAKHRSHIYQQIKNHGIKATTDEINKLLTVNLPHTLKIKLD